MGIVQLCSRKAISNIWLRSFLLGGRERCSFFKIICPGCKEFLAMAHTDFLVMTHIDFIVVTHMYFIVVSHMDFIVVTHMDFIEVASGVII